MKDEDNDITEMWKDIKKDRQVKHQQWNKDNLRIIEESCIICKIVSEECICFRLKKKADFYPSTGRWKDLKTGKMKSGGAIRFLEWYNK